MQTYTLPRDGQRPVRFTGEKVAESYGVWNGHNTHTRYYNLFLFQHQNRRWVVCWEYVSSWEKETMHNRVETYATMEEAIGALEDFDATAWVIGFKPYMRTEPGALNHYSTRQAELERSIRERYQAQVAEICAAVDIAEEL